MGLPVFSQGGGPGYIFQPTFGYLLAFPLTSLLVGIILQYHNKRKTGREPALRLIMLAHTAGMIVMFTIGAGILYLNLKYIAARPVDLSTVLWSGFIVFIPGSIVKIIMSAILARRLMPHLNISPGSVSE
jgi:biotin transport system substrate-specific component